MGSFPIIKVHVEGQVIRLNYKGRDEGLKCHASALQLWAGSPRARDQMAQGTQGLGAKPGTQKKRGPAPGPAHGPF